MRVTDRFTRRRTLATEITSERHRTAIVTDSSSQSKSSGTLQYLKGVGPVRAALLAKMGILTKHDLLFYYPRDWEDRRLRYSLRDAPMGEKVTLRARLREADFSETRSRLGIATAWLEDHTGRLQAAWFKKLNPRYDVFASLRSHLVKDQGVIVFGSMEWGPEGKQVRVEDVAFLEDEKAPLGGDDQFHFERIVPLYTVPEGLRERLLRSLIGRTLTAGPLALADVVPEQIRTQKKIRDLAWALRHIHFPQTWMEKEEARQALAFEEFLELETALAKLRLVVKKQSKAHAYALRRHLLTPFREKLRFEFTGSQKKVIREIFDDLMKPEPMNRLLQGDVGSGKTLVALSAMLLAVENGGQAVLMAPTEILAEQHALSFSKFLEGLPVRVAVLTGSSTSSQRKRLLQNIERGQVDLVLGTHALLEKQVRFHRLMLAIIDEQHRFGVEHRSLLREKGPAPDILVMTATPIPRTLAMTLYGDLDVSTLDALPPGRSPVQTSHVPEEVALRAVREAVELGRQVYLVYPLVSESDKIELKAAIQEAMLLKTTVLSGLQVGLIHGQMKSGEKDAMMERFRAGQIRVLIATSIIEVGIDVPNATLIVIQHAERFGLSTLHQLRGRVGRGPLPSQCLLVADTRSEGAKKRIEIMTQTTDGFRISEEDLALRGPGEVLGALQHGKPYFRMGNLLTDAALIQQSRQAAMAILHQDPELKETQHLPLRKAAEDRYGQKWSLTA